MKHPNRQEGHNMKPSVVLRTRLDDLPMNKK